MRSMFYPSYMKQSLFGQTWKAMLVYTLAFMLVQILYQTNIICKICITLGNNCITGNN